MDTFGKALVGYWDADPVRHYTIRRDDGFSEAFPSQMFFSGYEDWPDFEKKILGYVRREFLGRVWRKKRVLDIGAGAGRHSLYLQEKGFDVWAIDISHSAAWLMTHRGVKHAYICDIMDVGKLDSRNLREDYPPFGLIQFDYILMMFNNFGLAGDIEKTRQVLKILHRRSTSQVRIIATTVDPYKTDNPAHLAYHEKNKKEGKPAGQVRLRIEYKGEIGDWFSLLMVSVEELKNLIKGTGWSIFKIAEAKEGGYYGLVLKKN